jgi:hypothetical protein
MVNIDMQEPKHISMSQINENNHLSTDVLRDFAKQKIDEESSKDIKNDLIRELH